MTSMAQSRIQSVVRYAQPLSPLKTMSPQHDFFVKRFTVGAPEEGHSQSIALV
jgi:hypothetical protein